MRELIIGSRESILAVAQTKEVMENINRQKDMHASILTMKTTGDKIQNRTLDRVGGKGLFVKELDQALLDGRSDLSVHSLKDLPIELDERIPVLGYLQSENPLDVLVLPKGSGLAKLLHRNLSWEQAKDCIRNNIDRSKPVGTASQRRAKQFQKLFPDLEIAPVRGNVNTRLRKLDEGQYSALILAAAGLHRLGLDDRISYTFGLEQMVPSAGQGIIVVQGRAGEDYSCLKSIFSDYSGKRVLCERAFIEQIQGGCSTPVGAFAEHTESGMILHGYYYNEETGLDAREELVIHSLDDAELILAGRELANRLLEKTADR